MLTGCVTRLMFMKTTCGTFQQSTTVCSVVNSMVFLTPTPFVSAKSFLTRGKMSKDKCCFIFSYMYSLLAAGICVANAAISVLSQIMFILENNLFGLLN